MSPEIVAAMLAQQRKEKELQAKTDKESEDV